mgnify:CR=1 FL=1
MGEIFAGDDGHAQGGTRTGADDVIVDECATAFGKHYPVYACTECSADEHADIFGIVYLIEDEQVGVFRTVFEEGVEVMILDGADGRGDALVLLCSGKGIEFGLGHGVAGDALFVNLVQDAFNTVGTGFLGDIDPVYLLACYKRFTQGVGTEDDLTSHGVSLFPSAHVRRRWGRVRGWWFQAGCVWGRRRGHVQ